MFKKLLPALLALAIASGSSFAQTVIVGTNGNDVLTGSPLGSEIHGLGGADTINGGIGGNTLAGGTGPDTITGGPNQDIIFDGNFNTSQPPADCDVDTINAVDGAGHDIIFAGPNDVITADPADTVVIRAMYTNTIIFEGTFADYQTWKGVIQQVDNIIQSGLAVGYGAEETYWVLVELLLAGYEWSLIYDVWQVSMDSGGGFEAFLELAITVLNS